MFRLPISQQNSAHTRLNPLISSANLCVLRASAVNNRKLLNKKPFRPAQDERVIFRGTTLLQQLACVLRVTFTSRPLAAVSGLPVRAERYVRYLFTHRLQSDLRTLVPQEAYSRWPLFSVSGRSVLLLSFTALRVCGCGGIIRSYARVCQSVGRCTLKSV